MDSRLSKSQRIQRQRKMGECMKCMRRMDEFALKPFFIHRYEKEKMKFEDQYLDLFMRDGEKMEEQYIKEEINRSKTKRMSMKMSRSGGLKGFDPEAARMALPEHKGVDMSSPREFTQGDSVKISSG